ncbi:Tat pathway signal sequence domain protein [bacterium]|nr:Tat pathway signal sequence domain protein [candidate division CSSED10-310 bacterium]
MRRLHHVFAASCVLLVMMTSASCNNSSVTSQQDNITSATETQPEEYGYINETSKIPASGELLVGYEPLTPSYRDVTIGSIDKVLSPIPHIRIKGKFSQEDPISFSIYLPSKELWEGRFFQMVYPLYSENASDQTLGFHFDSKAYTVQTNSRLGYMGNAAAANLSRTIAANFYDYSEKIYGYIYGGSGGSYQTIGGAESDNCVWDGAVPYIIGIPSSMNNFLIRGFARIILADKAELIADAVRPGGSGDPYSGLSEIEKSVLTEISKLGIPLIAWDDYEYLLGLKSNLLDQNVPVDYIKAFWTESGYLGTEKSDLGDLFRKLRTNGSFSEAQLAAAAYHRYAIPGPNYYAWDHLRADDGEPMYPQFSADPPNTFMGTTSAVSGGAVYDGNIKCKMIVVENMKDVDACPWSGDWYRARVAESLGSHYEDSFRIWFNENADHIGSDVQASRSHRLISYFGIVQQALRDVSAWVEEGIEPAKSTAYRVVDSQIILAPYAAERQGIQPVVTLSVNGSDRVDIVAGQQVEFEATIELTPGSGKIVLIEWDFSGTGDYKSVGFEREQDGKLNIVADFTYGEIGTYFPTIRVTTQREGDLDTQYGNVRNLGRVRVVVSQP